MRKLATYFTSAKRTLWNELSSPLLVEELSAACTLMADSLGPVAMILYRARLQVVEINAIID